MITADGPYTLTAAHRLVQRLQSPPIAIVPSRTIKKRARPFGYADVLRETAKAWNIRLYQLLGRGLSPTVALPRNVAMYLCREMFAMSYPYLGAVFGRDHVTVLGACRRVTERIKIDPEFASRVALLETDIHRRYGL